VDEPFLEATPNVGIFFSRWLGRGFTFGEAGFACQPALSWQTTVLGDPLYHPFGRVPKQQHEALLARKSDLAAWSFVRIADVEAELGLPLTNTIQYLAEQPLAERSAVLSEKLGDLYLKNDDGLDAFYAYKRALKLKPTPQQRRRLEKVIEVARTAGAGR